MTRTFCDACDRQIDDREKRAEMGVSWSVDANIEHREDEYEICLECATKVRWFLEHHPSSLPPAPPKPEKKGRR